MHATALPAGTHIDEYRVERLLGHGGFGLTYLARDTHLNSLFAIKEYLPQECAVRTGTTVTANSEANEEGFRGGLDRFKQEARALARFRHPHIARVTRLLEANGTAYMVMEYEPGLTLSEFLKHRHTTLSESEAVALAVPLLEGLEALHGVGLVHRDIKPSNIFLRARGGAMLIDFGSARQVVTNSGAPLTSTYTPGFAPIEQYGSDEKQGPPADLYALGATLYRAVSGRTPADAVRRSAALGAGDLDPLDPATDFASDTLSFEFLECLDWALEFRAMDRPQSAHAWRERLTAVQVEPVDLSALLYSTGAIEGLTAQAAGSLQAGYAPGQSTHSPRTRSQGGFARFNAALKELRRRKVFRVGLWYIGLGAAAMQGMSVLQGPLDIALGEMRRGVAGILTGFPIALLLAWAFEMTPTGIRFSRERRGGSLRRIEFAVIGVMTLATVGVGYRYYKPQQESAGFDGTTISLAAAGPAVPAGATEMRQRSIAVLPFTDLSSESDQAWFCDGLAEEVLNLLVAQPDLRVAARMQSFRYRNQQDDVTKIGAELKVGYVLAGSVRRVGDQVRVTAELMDARTGFQVWSQTIPGELKDVFAAQATIAKQIEAKVVGTFNTP